MSEYIVHLLRDIGACAESIAWAKQLPDDITPERAFETCPRGDWKDWLAARGCTSVSAATAEVLERLPLDAYRHSTRRRGKAPCVTPELQVRCFNARLHGAKRVAVVRCNRCNGDGCCACDDDGRLRKEVLHPADEWTLAALAKIPPQRTGGAVQP